ncbi:MAG: ComF family protein [Cyanobacteria bacterium REEB459]|nr:ComF family protein [Cyanobacteria bacterium REEB459]
MGTGQSLWQQARHQLLTLFLAAPCPLCQRPTKTWLCPCCERQVRLCQLSTPLQASQFDLPVISWGRYEGHLRRAIGVFKYDRQHHLAPGLGRELGQTWQAHRPVGSSLPLTLVPIPLHPSKLQQRGFNQAELLALWVSRISTVPLCPQGLLRVQATEAQHHLSRRARQQNLAQAFAINPSQATYLRRRSVWLVDDIFTSGATAQAATQVLRAGGIRVAGMCTLARTEAWQSSLARAKS